MSGAAENPYIKYAPMAPAPKIAADLISRTDSPFATACISIMPITSYYGSFSKQLFTI